jgi:succinoglycan biosynthesis protein ExoA
MEQPLDTSAGEASPATSWPAVTLIVAMRNERTAIEDCLRSIAAQAYPAERLEVLVYDGGSDDGSRAIAEAIVAGHSTWAVRDNPKRIQAAAWNLGIRAAGGDIIGIVSAHAELDPDYVAQAVQTLESSGASMVGGPFTAIAEGTEGRAISIATSSRFGIGNATHHFASRRVEVDTVFMGVCRAQTYRDLMFDERMVRNQDDELSYRLRAAGGVIICDPGIRSTYRNRATLGSLWRQYFAYGFWKVEVLARHPAQMRPRQFAPPAFVGGMAGLALLSPFWVPARVLGTLCAATYAAAVALVAAGHARRAPHPRWMLLAAAFATLHFSYGAGFILGLLRRFRPGRGTRP